MSLDISVEFPRQELKKSLDNIQGLLDAAKPLAEQLVPDEKVKEAIVKCIEAVQVFLSENNDAQESLQTGVEAEYYANVVKQNKDLDRMLELRNKKDDVGLTQEEQQELDSLEKQYQ